MLVCDGFTGNVAVKVTEGIAEFIFDELKAAISSRLRFKLAALVLRPALLQMRSKMDYGEHGGAPLLGVNGVVIVAHGKADAQAMKNAVRLAQKAANSGMLDALRGALESPQSEGHKEAVAANPSSDETRA